MNVLLLVLSPDDTNKIYYASCSETCKTREEFFRKCIISRPGLPHLQYVRLRDLALDINVRRFLLEDVDYIAIMNIGHAVPEFFHILPKDRVEFTVNSVILRLGNGKRRIITLPRIYDVPHFEITEIDDPDPSSESNRTVVDGSCTYLSTELFYNRENSRKYISLAVDGSTLEEVDRIAQRLGTTRNGLIRLLLHAVANHIITLRRSSKEVELCLQDRCNQ
ncbi:MAG: hypothetical protein GXO26_00775 [Crenarchaeota archaeon]|nr:hypothetical protein [Thermoproteota archaeon]